MPELGWSQRGLSALAEQSSMSISAITERKLPALKRGDVAVCIPVTAGPDTLHQCLRNVVAHTSPGVPVIVAGEPDEDIAVAQFVASLGGDLHYVQELDAAGAVGLANAAFAICGGADVVLLASHALVFDGWLDHLRAIAQSSSIVGSVSTLGNGSGLFSVPAGDRRSDLSLESMAARIADETLSCSPRTPMADGHCIWIPRAALELAGELDTAFKSLRAALIDFSQRCLQHGMLSRVAADVYVPSVLPGSLASGHSGFPTADYDLLMRRHPQVGPYLEPFVDLEPSELLRARSAAEHAIRELSVTVDARILRDGISGPQAATVELIEKLVGLEMLRVRALVDPEIKGDALAALQRIGDAVESLPASEVDKETPRTDLVHRPYQVSSAQDLDLLIQLGERLLLTQLDLIAYNNPSYFPSFELWQHHRRLTRQALAIADRVIFNTEYVAEDAVAEGLLDAQRVSVIPLAVRREAASPKERRPRGVEQGNFLLCLGNDYRHKHRVFAIKLLAALRQLGWDGTLVLAGGHIEWGSSRGDEAAYLASHPALTSHVKQLPAVSEFEKAWLFANAAALVYPSVSEGFGLIPFEACRAGLPCLFAPQTSLNELLPETAAVLVPWDPAESARRALPLLTDELARQLHLEQIEQAAAELESWEQIGERLLETYRGAASASFREAAALARDAQTKEAALGRWAVGLEKDMGTVIGPDAYLPADVQRALLAAATRKSTRRPLFALLRGFYRLSRPKRRG